MLAVKSIELSIGKIEVTYRKGELSCCIDELADYLMGENMYNTTEEQLIKYYDAFL